MRNNQAGFTLLELLIALAITGVIASVAVVAYRDYIETAELGVLRQRVDAMILFQENYHIDNDTYFEGTYTSGGDNPFSAIGYVVRDDDDGITLTVANCDGGDLSDCFSVTATSANGQIVRWDNGRYLPQ